MISSYGKALLYALSLNREELLNVISPEGEKGIYFDRDSEDEGTFFIELSLLRVFYYAFSHVEDVDDVEGQLSELCWLIGHVDQISRTTYLPLSLSLPDDESHSKFWAIVRRYASQLCKLLGVHSDALTGFSFEEALIKYGHSFKRLSRDEWLKQVMIKAGFEDGGEV